MGFKREWPCKLWAALGIYLFLEKWGLCKVRMNLKVPIPNISTNLECCKRNTLQRGEGGRELRTSPLERKRATIWRSLLIRPIDWTINQRGVNILGFWIQSCEVLMLTPGRLSVPGTCFLFPVTSLQGSLKVLRTLLRSHFFWGSVFFCLFV